MNIKTLALVTAAFSLFAVEAFAQANHNTSRSNKTGANVPEDTAKPQAKPNSQVSSDATDDLLEPNIKIAKDGPEMTGHVTLVRSKGPNGDNTATGCVMFNGAADNDCDGVADGKRILDNRTDIDANTSAVKGNTGCLMPDRTLDIDCDGVADTVDTKEGDDRVRPKPRPRNIYQRRN